MKNFKFTLIIFFGFLSSSCNLEEDPIVLNPSLYNTVNGASAALDGVYRRATEYSAQERRFFLVNGYSGFFNTNKGGFRTDNFENLNLFSLKPVADAATESMFRATYAIIAQANSIIANTNSVENPISEEELLFNDIKGQAYFVRAWSYFTLVRLFGDIPLWLELPDSNNLSKAKSTAKEVYAQAIIDTKVASNLINGAKGAGYPKVYAANMLLAKLYMTLATNTSLQADGLSEMDYWELAYDEAIKVYGNYTLIGNYNNLFTDEFENTSESIFELQCSTAAANSQMGRDFSPWRYKQDLAFAHFKINAVVYDQHAAAYPGDPRIAGTYVSTYQRGDTGGTQKFYPDNPRTNYFRSHPYFFKFAEKDQTTNGQFGNQNVVVYRYAELLIMLAEISNELQNGEQLGYITEVLDRVGMTPLPDYSNSKEEFRDAIMNEYSFELLGEGEDSHNNRRRGYSYFKTNVIDKHNNYSKFDSNVDLTLNIDESQVMILPFPSGEINFNDLIND